MFFFFFLEISSESCLMQLYQFSIFCISEVYTLFNMQLYADILSITNIFLCWLLCILWNCFTDFHISAERKLNTISLV